MQLKNSNALCMYTRVFTALQVQVLIWQKKQAVLDLRLKRKKYEKSLRLDFLDAVGYQGLACSPQRCFINLQSHVAVTK